MDEFDTKYRMALKQQMRILHLDRGLDECIPIPHRRRQVCVAQIYFRMPEGH